MAGIKGAGDMDGQSLLGPLLNASTAKPSRIYTYHEYNSLGNYTVNHGLIDDPISHTWRAVRFPHNEPFGYPIMYAEFTQLDNWNFEHMDPAVPNPGVYHFFELFNTEADPGRMQNLYPNASSKMKLALHKLVTDNFHCTRQLCLNPIDLEDGIQ